MAFPLIPVIAAAATMAASGISAASAKKQQKRANKFNVEMWNRQNAYNSPASQMQRYKQASLNPNLIYGSSGNSGNAGPAPQFTAMSETGYRPVDPTNVLNNIQAFTDWDIKKAQEDKLQTSIELDKARILDTQASAVGKSLSNITGKEKARIASQMADISLDAAKANVHKTQAATQFTLDQNERAKIDNARNVYEAIERVASSRIGRQLTGEQIKAIRQDQRIKSFDEMLVQNGINPKSPDWIRHMQTLIKELTSGNDLGTPDPGDIVGSMLKRLFSRKRNP